MGPVASRDYRGRWLLFFSHPADFTPVCTSELIAFAKAAPRFEALNCALLALSIDGLYSHLAWLHSIKANFDIDIPFPVVEDPSMAIARAYGMLPPRAVSSSTVRGMFLIDPEGIVKAITWYPISTGRSVEEALRLVQAVSMTYQEALYAPADWQPGAPGVVAPPKTIADATQRKDEDGAADWYYQTRPTRIAPADATAVGGHAAAARTGARGRHREGK
ncbi:1-Cys peroxiredoxin [Chitinasiproducens palmae]|uniref:Thioredoxin peroxidase n=2 Tax=Chitinasiproducens palmae TaxID=1770053 RepID=A0A1H2PS47_9BURK|nr:1-Cys peroxiredoxin [Chitinasiproducens palmae]